MSRYQGLIIDADTHHQPSSPSELLPYLPQHWRAYAEADPRRKFSSSPNGGNLGKLGAADVKADSRSKGGPKGSSFELYREQHLEKFNYYRTLLLHQTGDQGTHTNQYLARALCEALNQWCIDTWLTYDERLVSAIVIPTAEPTEAARVIRQFGTHPQMVAVLISGNPLGRPFGDPLFHPIYEAAAEMGLPIALHHNHSHNLPNSSALMVGGWINQIAGSVSTQQGMHYVSSLITHGVFEKYPSLRFVITEFGLGWLPSVMMGLDEAYKWLKVESPWVKRWPSEYIHDHVSLTTQPLEVSPDDSGALAQLLGTIDGVEDMLLFSSDYPHGSTDTPDYAERYLPAAWWPKIFRENASKVYGIPLPLVEEAPVTAMRS